MSVALPIAATAVFVFMVVGAVYWLLVSRSYASDIVMVRGRAYRVLRVDEAGEPTLVRINDRMSS